MTQKNAATYYRNAGFGNPTMQHIENYSATVDEEEFTKDKNLLESMVSELSVLFMFVWIVFETSTYLFHLLIFPHR